MPPKTEDDDGSKAVVLLSGGIDSATCLAIAADEYEEIIPVHYDYGQQTAAIEQERAHKQREHIESIYDVEIRPVEVVNYQRVFRYFAGGVASNRDSFTTEDGELEEEDGRSTGYVPMRNLHLIATGAAFADVNNADAVFHGAQGGDEESYPDCRRKFMDSAAGAINRSLADDDYVDLRTPLIHRSKVEVINLGETYGVEWEYTYSCYEETDFEDPDPCGECPACVERIEAFEEANAEDPVHE